MLLGVRQAGINARGKRRPVTGTKEFQGSGWKWILIRVATPASLPLSLSLSLALPSLAPAGQTPSPWCFVVLLWLFKSFLKAPGLTQQQHIGQSDSTVNPPPFYCTHTPTFILFSFFCLLPYFFASMQPPSCHVSTPLLSWCHVFMYSHFRSFIFSTGSATVS